MTALPANLVDLGRIFTGMAESLGKLGDSVAHLVTLGTRGWDASRARALRGRLIEMSVSLNKLHRINGVDYRGLEIFELYVRDAHAILRYDGPPKANREEIISQTWKETASRLANGLSQGAKLLDELSTERSDFVFSEAYTALFDVLSSRDLLLRSLCDLEQPRTVEDLQTLDDLMECYKHLRSEMRSCIDKLGKYAVDQD